MADISNDLTTTASVDQGDQYTGEIDVVGDEDWIAVTLTAGVTYGFSLRGLLSNNGTLEDPYIKGLYDSDGNSLGLEDDDSGDGRESLLVFTPDTSGTYYVAAGSWDGPYDGYDPTGTYTFSYGEYTGAPSTPYSEAFAEQIEANGVTEVDALLSLWRYKNLEGSETLTVTYSYPTNGSVYSEDPDFGYGPESPDAEPWAGIGYLTEAEKALFDDALSQISSFANIAFTEVPDNAESAGVIRPAWTDLADEDAAAWAYLPFSSSQAGDVWFLTQNQDTGGRGSYFHTVVLHELGHAVGLKHTFDADDGTGVVMPAEYDGLEYTVMSYNSSIDTDIVSLDFYPTTYMYYDILAIQHLYGAIETNTGNTTYSFELGTKYYETVWDTAGTDTYDASSQTSSVKLDLTPGSWSDVGTTVIMYYIVGNTIKSDTVFTPPEITIENAIGGSGNDSLVGNTADNDLQGNAGNDVLTGGSGEDTLAGGGGNDTLSGGSGDDILSFGSAWGDDVISDFEDNADKIDLSAAGLTYDDLTITDSGNDALISDGSGNTIRVKGISASALTESDFDTSANSVDPGTDDTLTGTIEADSLSGGDGDDVLIGGDGGDTLDGGADRDILDGGSGSDRLYGGTHADSISGGAGNDILFGDHGSDTLDGGAGTDVVQYLSSGTGVTVNLVTGVGTSGQAKGDILVDIENIRGSRASDHLIGDSGDNKFIGYGGWDTLEGGDGNDRLEGWLGHDVLDGGNGDDYLFGGAHQDTLTGGDGNDTLVGGRQKDIFVFAEGSDDDIITDFDATSDALNLTDTATDFSDVASVLAAASETSEGLLIDLGAGDSVLIYGVSLNDLSDINFIFG